MLNLLTAECTANGINLKDAYITLDFEAAVINSYKKLIGTKIRGCRFHLDQAWHRRIIQEGLGSSYLAAKSRVGSWLRLCFGLPAIDADMVGELFEEFAADAPIEVKSFIDYMRNNFISPRSRYPPTMWASA